MPQPESVKTGFQSDVWNKGIEVIRYVKEREKTFREKLDDDFYEGRAVQVEEPLYVTFKHALKKDLKLKRMRAERRRDAKREVCYYLNDFSNGSCPVWPIYFHKILFR
uniref:Uncharacterized protein n=1 Tax=Meloidogyne hapla TaxID=6305 RepID=A0A1I8BRV9_MELHA